MAKGKRVTGELPCELVRGAFLMYGLWELPLACVAGTGRAINTLLSGLA